MSAILSADDLNDFISPGVACVKPIETLPLPAPDDDALEHEVIRDGAPSAAGSAAPASISLTDCLACSGCVTSAEAVLVSLQSHAEVLHALDAAPALELRPLSLSPSSTSTSTLPYTVHGLDDPARRLYVASVSPQSRASLAAVCGPGVTERQAGYMLEHLLLGPLGLRSSRDGNGSGNSYGNSFAWVVDTNAAREATLVLGADEVTAAEKEKETDQKDTAKTAKTARTARPLLASSCPGWVCYAEKTHPHVLGHLSHVKSPQALTGTLLKTTLSRRLGIPPDRIWHVAVMPCFDKKLEASREELTDAVWNPSGHPSSSGKPVRDVDCVITSREVLMLAESCGIDFFSLPKTPWPSSTYPDSLALPPHLPFPDPVLDRFLFPPHRLHRGRSAPPTSAAGSSGGNLHFILQSVLAQNPGAHLQTTRGRNVDVVEYAVVSPQPEQPVLFRAARYYGFRNIQNLVRRLRPPRPSRLPGSAAGAAGRRVPNPRGGAGGSGLDYAYVEVMACPGGCTNGGGQIKMDDPIVVDRRGLTSKPGPEEQKAWLAQVDEAYFSADDDMDVESEDVEEGADVKGPAGRGREDEMDGISPSYVRETLAHWSRITDIDLRLLAYTTFREVVSDVGKPLKKGDAAERVIQLASKIGGGW